MAKFKIGDKVSYGFKKIKTFIVGFDPKDGLYIIILNGGWKLSVQDDIKSYHKLYGMTDTSKGCRWAGERELTARSVCVDCQKYKICNSR